MLQSKKTHKFCWTELEIKEQVRKSVKLEWLPVNHIHRASEIIHFMTNTESDFSELSLITIFLCRYFNDAKNYRFL